MELKQVVSDIFREVAPLSSQGKVADYIPALAKVSPKLLAISLNWRCINSILNPKYFKSFWFYFGL